ncbi:MAG: hypothetical protein IPH31_22150 [Lewinellaceae bacterium]|nr:hypothetical protein [Lewinellaceae bacterium]
MYSCPFRSFCRLKAPGRAIRLVYLQAGYYFIPTYSTLYGDNGDDIILRRKVSERQLQIYGEYGLGKKTTLILSAPIVFYQRGASNTEAPFYYVPTDTGSIVGLGNATIALRHQFLSGPWALAGTLSIGLPAGASYQQLTDLRTGYQAFTIQPMVSLGRGGRKTYGFLYGSYGYRSNHYSHFLQLGAETGVHVGKFWLIGFSEWRYSLENGSKELPAIDVLTGLYANDQGWWSVGVKAIWEINRFVGLSVSGAGAGWAQYVPKSPGLGAAVYFKWD